MQVTFGWTGQERQPRKSKRDGGHPILQCRRRVRLLLQLLAAPNPAQRAGPGRRVSTTSRDRSSPAIPTWRKFARPSHRWSPPAWAAAARGRPARTGSRLKSGSCTRLSWQNTQHADLRVILLSTCKATIVEHTENDAYCDDGGDGRGWNRLERILMRVRKELLAPETNSMIMPAQLYFI